MTQLFITSRMQVNCMIESSRNDPVKFVCWKRLVYLQLLELNTRDLIPFAFCDDKLLRTEGDEAYLVSLATDLDGLIDNLHD